MMYIYLLLAIFFEVGWALSMKLSAGFTKAPFVISTLVMYLLSVVFLMLATRTMDIGVGYAIWAGAGVALIATAGIVYFQEPLTAGKILAIGLIVSGIVLLHILGNGH
jgi:multidrug transporter EmrE-like cation transporter